MTSTFKTQAVRDLVWALGSPSLMDHPLVVDVAWGEHEIAANPGLIHRLDRVGSPLTQALEKRKSKRLGEYFETLIITWLRENPEANVLASNWQVKGGKGTLGEFDLLFERDRITHHWELAVKFYLGHPGPEGQSLWYGPNSKDRLDLKWPKMLNQQLRLSQHPEAQSALRATGARGKATPAAYIKGYLFEALSSEFQVEHDPQTNPDGLRGWWAHDSDLLNHRDAINAQGFVVLSRLRWLSPVFVAEDDELATLDDLIGRADKRAIHVAAVSKVEGAWQEVSRGFIVPDRWPG